MARRLSKTSKLVLLLTIDIVFFLIELIVGKSIASLSLLAALAKQFLRFQRTLPRTGGRCLPYGAYRALITLLSLLSDQFH